MAIDPVLDALKEQTQSLHSRLEARVDLPSRLQTKQAYQQLLTAFYGFYAPVEDRLTASAELQSAGLNMDARCKVPLLISDLDYWNISIDRLPRASSLPRIASASEGFGCLYVMEGATLGSQIIKRLLKEHLAISTDNGGAFFNAYQDHVGDMWQAFRQTLSSYAGNHPSERETIVATARDTFVSLENWFGHCLN